MDAFIDALDAATDDIATGRAEPDSARVELERRFRGIMAQWGDRARVATAYRDLLRFSFAPPPPQPPEQAALAPPAPPGGEGASPSSSTVVVSVTAAVAATAVGVAVLVLIAVYVRRAQRLHRSLLKGAVLPPKVGPDTTLLITGAYTRMPCRTVAPWC